MKTVTLFGTVYPVRGLVSLICSTVFFFSLSGGQTSRDMYLLANFVWIFILNPRSQWSIKSGIEQLGKASFLLSNLMTYMISYMRVENEDLTYADFVYVSTGRSLVSGLLGMLGGILANKIGLRPTLLLGATFYRWEKRFIESLRNLCICDILQWRMGPYLLCPGTWSLGLCYICRMLHWLGTVFLWRSPCCICHEGMKMSFIDFPNQKVSFCSGFLESVVLWGAL